MLRHRGWEVNHKRVYRLYKEEGLVIRSKTPRRKRSCRYRGERDEISRPNQTWAMDFMSDTLFDNRRYRILTIVDCHSRESLAVEPRQSFRAFHVVEALDRIVRERGKPKTIRCDNGPEFAGRMLDQWAFFNQVELDFSRPARPTDNAFIEVQPNVSESSQKARTRPYARRTLRARPPGSNAVSSRSSSRMRRR